MGLLDSNKVMLLEKANSISVDLSSTGSVGTVDCKGYNRIYFSVVTASPSIGMSVKGGLYSPYETLDVYSTDTGEKVGVSITSAGNYFVVCEDVSGLGFYNNTAVSGGSATIHYLLKTLSEEKVNTIIAYNNAVATNAVISITNPDYAWGCLKIKVTSVSSGAKLIAANSGEYMPFFSNNGSILYALEEKGTYYINLEGVDGLSLTNIGSASITVKVEKIHTFPIAITNIKPKQIIAQFTNTLTAGQTSIVNQIVHPERLLVKHFKFFYVSIQSKDSNNANKRITGSIKFSGYDLEGSSWTDGTIVGEFTSKYRFQTEWFGGSGVGQAGIITTIDAAAEGDKLSVMLIGIR